jgi:broad specificity phosphatase PhoE
VEIVLVRHAQPDWEPEGKSVDEPGLTPLGREQARLTAKALEGRHFDAYYASPLLRVAQTAAPISEMLGMEPTVASWLREFQLPSMQGLPPKEVQRLFRDANERELSQWWEGMEGGESFRHFYERVSSGIEGLLSGDHRVTIHENAGHRLWQLPERAERILIVAHEGTNAVLLSHLLGIEPVPWAWVRFSSAWTGISQLHTLAVAGGGIWALESFNRTEHLAPLASHPAWVRDGRGADTDGFL